MFVTGPDVVKTVTHENVTHEQLGGARHPFAASPASPTSPSRTMSRRCCSCAASSTSCRPPTARSAPARARPPDPIDRDELSLDTLIPANPNKPYDMKELIPKVVDEGDFFELQPDYAKNIIIGFARMDGETVGIVANQPMVLAGCLDIDSSAQGRALRALLRLLQHPDRDLRRRARLPARHRAGIRRASSSTAPSCCSPMARRRCRRSRSSPARPMAAPMTS